MLDRRKLMGTWLASMVLAATMAAGVLPAQARADEFGEGAQKFITALASNAIEQLTANGITRDERSRRFRQLMLKSFAVEGIGKFVLGRHWRQATEAEQKEYLKLFEDLLVVTYADRFSTYSGETLDVQKTEVRGGKDAIVHSTIHKVDATKPLSVAWRVRGKDDKYWIVDIMVEGISMVQTQKAEFSSFIKQNGGKLEALLAELRKRIQANT